MDWLDPSDEFGHRLAIAAEAILVNAADPWRAAEAFEPILVELRSNRAIREEGLARGRSLGRQLFAAIGSGGTPVAMEIRHYCWHLQHREGPGSIEEPPDEQRPDRWAPFSRGV